MPAKPIRIFTETSADARNINAQSLTVREIFSRLDPQRFEVAMTHLDSVVDPRIAERPNTRLIHGSGHGKTIKYLANLFAFRPDIYFYPQPSPVNEAFLRIRHLFHLRTRVVVHAVTTYSLGTNIRRDWLGGDSLVRAIKEADVVAGNSRFVTQDTEKFFNVKAITIHNGIDRTCFYPQEQKSTGSSAPVKVLFAGSFRSYKRPEMVVEAAAKFPTATFLMVGDGEEKKACEEMVQSMDLKNISIRPSVPRAELGDIMREMDLFILPSIVEGHPQVLGQAAASGLPCVAMNCYSPDYVVHDKTGFLAADDQEFFSYFKVLIENADLRMQFSKAAIDHAKQFDWDRIAAQWAGVFESLVERNRVI